MIIELQQALSPEDLGPDTCGICGQDFVVSTVIASGTSDGRADMGQACPECIEYLGRRSDSCPTIEQYWDLLEQYPDPVWMDDSECDRYMYNASSEEQMRVYESARLFKV